MSKSTVTKRNATLSSIASTATLAFALSSTAGSVLADNPFGATSLSDGYQVADASKAKEGKCGEAKCGGDAEKAAEGKCGEAKCGGDAEKAAEGKCGEAKCGGDAEKAAEAKCGEAKCGGDAEKASEAKCGEAKCGGAH